MAYTYTDVGLPWNLASYLLTERYGVDGSEGRNYCRNGCRFHNQNNLIFLCSIDSYQKAIESDQAVLNAFDFIYNNYGIIGILHTVTACFLEFTKVEYKDSASFIAACKTAIKQELKLLPKYDPLVTCNLKDDVINIIALADYKSAY
ncbi:hypothetical protein ACN1T7_003062 [Vibrio cholerae]